MEEQDIPSGKFYTENYCRCSTCDYVFHVDELDCDLMCTECAYARYNAGNHYD